MDDRIFRFAGALSGHSLRPQWLRQFALFAVALTCILIQNNDAVGQSKWIWSPRQETENAGQTECYFRKKFSLVRPEKSELFITAGDRFSLFINGQLASEGDSFGSVQKLDITPFLRPGVNLVAARVVHQNSDRVGLAIRLRVLESGESRWRSLITDGSWKTRLRPIDGWKSITHNDLGWLRAAEIQVAKKLYEGLPVANTTGNAGPSELLQAASTGEPNAQLASNQTSETSGPADGSSDSQPAKQAGERFTISDEFVVQQVMLAEETGSLIAMAFNEFNKLILSREGGPLLMADFARPQNDPARISVICDQVSSCQGILPLNGEILVTGQGPEGLGLYRLADADHDGNYEPVQTLVKFKGQLGEHGPHGLTLGNDGMIYVVLGNATGPEGAVASTGPYQNFYEGDLVKRYEDPAGHAAGIKAPGGTVIRVSLDGSSVETVAGGLRNAYDLVFDQRGELYVHDSDMESDMGMSWYRPTMIFNVSAGAEFGWRSGWAKFPNYFVDQTPAVCDTGRGSPAGAVIYQHVQFPARYHNSLFFADWSEGRILAVRPRVDGAGASAEVEEFLKGKPLNVVDLEVGEDGALYFCTGGRGTAGGVYRIAWTGQVPPSMLEFNDDIARVVRHPQPTAAWARQNIAKLRQSIGESWNQALTDVAREINRPAIQRIQALDNLVLHGPFPSNELLSELAGDSDWELRAKTAKLCGLNDSPFHVDTLTELLLDPHPRVRRLAAESFLRIHKTPAFEQLVPMLGSLDRVEAGVARRLLERIPLTNWKEEILQAENTRVFIQGCLTLMTAHPTTEHAYAVLARVSELTEGFVNDRDFVDLLRLTQVALFQGQVDPDRIPAFTARMRGEFPSGSGTINRELARILAYLQAGSYEGRLVQYFQSDDEATDSETDKLHVAMFLQTAGKNLTPDERLAVLNYLESTIRDKSNGSFALYVQRAIGELAGAMAEDQIHSIIEKGHEWPNALVATFYRLPQTLTVELRQSMIDLDQRLMERGDSRSEQARLGIIAILARDGDAASMEYLRQTWREEPERRSDIAIGLAQQPEGENWPYLVSSLPILDDLTSIEVLEKLAEVNLKPKDAEHFRQVISLGYRLRTNGAKKAALLLEHWAGESVSPLAGDWLMIMNRWKVWFEQQWPEEREIRIERAPAVGKYDVEEVLRYLENNPGDLQLGKQVFAKAQCGNCHRCGSSGVTAGPDLTSVARRFSQRELAESIIHPSMVVSDQYRANVVLTVTGETFSGMTMTEPDGALLVIQPDGTRIRVAADDIEEMKETELSAMPERLLDTLSLPEIASLFAFMENADSRRSESTDDAATVR